MSATRSTPATDGARTVLALALIAASALCAKAAAAQAPNDTVLAETLFREGKELMAAKQFDVACPKLAESYRLDAGTGTLLALALCHEAGGKIASAWIEFTDVLAATSDTRPDRALLAREHLAALEPQLSKVTIVVPGSLADAPGLTILRDDVRLERPAWGAPVPLDGGSHTLDVKAANRAPWHLRFDVAAIRDRRVIEIPALPADTDGAVVATPSPREPIAARPDVARQRWALGFGAVGVAGIGVGTWFGVTALTKIHDAKAQCPNAPTCANASAVSSNTEGLHDATVADVAIGAGVVAGLVALYLGLSGRASPSASLRVVPSIDRYGAAFTVTHPL